jgi:tripartite ATP-independent transporter DctP family solute receptor
MNRSSRRMLSIATVFVLAFTATACSGGGQSTAESASPAAGESEPAQSQATAEFEERTLAVAYTTPETFPYHDGFTRFKELVEERSGGKITVDLFPGAQLGGERDTEEGLLEGSVQVVLAAGALANFAPIYNLVELPFLIKNQEHMEAIINSDVGVQLADAIEEQGGFHVIGWFSTGDSAIQTVDTPIESPSDLSGIKIRVQENPALIDAVTALGGNATPLPFADVYTALQTGVIEGAHLDWNAVNSIKLTELIHYSTTPDIAFLAEPRPVVMSVEYWESMNDAERELIATAMTEAAEYERGVILERQDDAVQTVRDAGVEFTEIDEDAFIELVRPVWEKWSDELDAADIIEAINELRP